MPYLILISNGASTDLFILTAGPAEPGGRGAGGPWFPQSFSISIQGVTKRMDPLTNFPIFDHFFSIFLKFSCTQLKKKSKASCLVCAMIKFNLLGGHFRLKDKDLHLM